MAPFKPDKRQQRLIDAAIKSHREAQASGKHAPDRLVENRSSELGLDRMIGLRSGLGSTMQSLTVYPPNGKPKNPSPMVASPRALRKSIGVVESVTEPDEIGALSAQIAELYMGNGACDGESSKEVMHALRATARNGTPLGICA